MNKKEKETLKKFLEINEDLIKEGHLLQLIELAQEVTENTSSKVITPLLQLVYNMYTQGMYEPNFYVIIITSPQFNNIHGFAGNFYNGRVTTQWKIGKAKVFNTEKEAQTFLDSITHPLHSTYRILGLKE